MTSRSLIPLGAGLGVFAAIIGIIAIVVSLANVPDYGTWTGIRPLENKLERLEEFARQGEVDAIALGSSIVDFGFSAELFSQLMSEHLGHPYRMYNFASGGAEPRTLPILYRFARLAVKPKEVYVIAPPEPRLGEEIALRSPDFTLLNAPVAPALGDIRLLRLSRAYWKTPFLRNAAAVRDLMIFGTYKSIMPSVGQEAYGLSGHGDRMSYLAAWSTDALRNYRTNSDNTIRMPEASVWGSKKFEARLKHFFSNRDIAALNELRDLVASDGGRLFVLSHGAAGMLWERKNYPPEFRQAIREFYSSMATALGGSYIDVIDGFSVPEYAVSDYTHLNVYGARKYTEAAFARRINNQIELRADYFPGGYKAPSLDRLPADDITITPYAGIVLRPNGKPHTGLRVHYVDSLAVPPLPVGVEFSFALRRPDGTDLVVPARRVKPASFEANFDLPESSQVELYVVRLLAYVGGRNVALSSPVRGFSWIESAPN